MVGKVWRKTGKNGKQRLRISCFKPAFLVMNSKAVHKDAEREEGTTSAIFTVSIRHVYEKDKC